MTYTPLANITLTSTQQSVTFSSIPTSGFRDLILVGTFRSAVVGATVHIRVNNLSTSIYSAVGLLSNGSTNLPYTQNNSQQLWASDSELSPSSGSERGAFVAQFLDSNQTNKHKAVLIRANNVLTNGLASGRIATTNAITSILITQSQGTNGAFVAGSTFSLYGIAA